jgi:hypothetical protein
MNEFELAAYIEHNKGESFHVCDSCKPRLTRFSSKLIIIPKPTNYLYSCLTCNEDYTTIDGIHIINYTLNKPTTTYQIAAHPVSYLMHLKRQQGEQRANHFRPNFHSHR